METNFLSFRISVVFISSEKFQFRMQNFNNKVVCTVVRYLIIAIICETFIYIVLHNTLKERGKGDGDRGERGE